MYITEYLSNEIKPGKVNSSPSQLLEVVQENKLTHLPLFKGLDFVGNISEEDLIELSIDDEKVDYTSYLESFYLSESSTLLDAIQMMYTNQANILPIINEQSRYVGFITEMDIINTFANFPFVAAQGVSMLVSIAEKDLSMTAISNIIEVNNGKISVEHKFLDYNKELAAELVSKRGFEGAEKLAQILISPENRHV